MNAAEDDALARAFAAETPIFAAMLAAWDGPAALIAVHTAARSRRAVPVPVPVPVPVRSEPASPQMRQLLLVEVVIDQRGAGTKALTRTPAPDRSVVIRAAGQLNVLTAGLLDAPVRRALRGQPREVTLDLSGIAALTGAGLEALLELRQAAAVQGAELRLRAASRAVRELLDATGTAAVFDGGPLDLDPMAANQPVSERTISPLIS